MKTALFTFLLLTTGIIHSQNVISDSKGDFLFGVPVSDINTQVSLSKLELSTPLWNISPVRYWVGQIGDTTFTMVKTWIPFAKVGLVNNSESALMIKEGLDLSPTGEIGISNTFDSLLHPSFKKYTYFTASLSGTIKYQSFNLYDTMSKSFLSKETRWSPGIKGNFTIFHRTWFAVSFSASWEKGILTDDLTSYQKRPNSYYADQNIGVNGKKDGYLTPLNASNNYRFSISVPIFLPINLPLTIAPYCFSIMSDTKTPNHNAGIAISFLGEKFRNFDIATSGTPKPNSQYKFAESLTIGANIVSTNQPNPFYLFISGSFKISSFKRNKEAIVPSGTRGKRTY